MEDESFQAINENSPLIAWIHNISLNQQKYMKSKIKDYDFGHDVRYLMYIHDNPKCSQENLVTMFCQSKGNVAKIIKKFEDEGYIKRVGLTDNDYELRKRLREIAINGMNLTKEGV